MPAGISFYMSPRMIDSFHTLAAYAGRLLRLGGGDVIGGKHNPYFLAIDEAAATAGATGTEFISFANYDYLGLARHPEIEAAANDAECLAIWAETRDRFLGRSPAQSTLGPNRER